MLTLHYQTCDLKCHVILSSPPTVILDGVISSNRICNILKDEVYNDYLCYQIALFMYLNKDYPYKLKVKSVGSAADSMEQRYGCQIGSPNFKEHM